MSTEYLTLADVALKLSVSERTVRRWIAEGSLDAVRIGPRMLRVPADSVQALLMHPVGNAR